VRAELRAVAILLLIAACTLLLGACAVSPFGKPQPQPISGGALAGGIAVGTLSTNACEAAAAPFVTALGVRRLAAARLLREGRLSVSQAERVQLLADDARGVLLAACPRGVTHAGAADPAIALARQRIGEIESILGGR
jgi:hypothetical protein